MITCSRIRSLLFGISLIIGVLPTLTRAEEPELDVSFDFGYNGVVPKSMRLVPVKVKVTNKLHNLTGRIEILQPSNLGHEVTLYQEIRSPAPSTLTFTLYPRIEAMGGIGGYHLEGRVVFDDKSVQTFSKSVHAKSDKRLILTVGLPAFYRQNYERKPTAKSPLEGVYCKHAYQFINLHPIELPAELFGYDSIHALIISGQIFSQLSARQLSAIREYLIAGGRLLVYNPGTDQPIRLWLKSLKIDGTPPGSIRAMRVGAGCIVFQPYSSNRDVPYWVSKEHQGPGEFFLPEVVYDKMMVYPSAREPSGTGIIDQFIESRSDMSYGLPGIIWLVIIILVYCAIIGPLDWYITKRSGRHWLTWPFFAISILLFSFVSYWYSQVVQSAPMTSLTVNILDAQHGAPVAKGESLMWLHSTGNLEFQIQSAKPGTVFGCKESKSSDQSTAAWARILNKPAGNSEIVCRIPVFSSKRFTADWTEPPPFVPELDSSSPNKAKLPAGLALDRAYLTTADGIKQASYDPVTGALTMNGSFRSWRSVFTVLNERLLDTTQTLPSEEMLQTYLLAVSYGGKRLPVMLDGSASGINARLSEWEYSLNISDNHKPSQKVIFIFFKPEQPINTYSLNRRIPKRIEVNCLRYFLPAN